MTEYLNVCVCVCMMPCDGLVSQTGCISTPQDSVPRIDFGSTSTLSRIMHLLKMKGGIEISVKTADG